MSDPFDELVASSAPAPAFTMLAKSQLERDTLQSRLITLLRGGLLNQIHSLSALKLSVSVYLRLPVKQGSLGLDTFLQDLFVSLSLLVLLAGAHQHVEHARAGAAMRYLRRCTQPLADMAFSLFVVHVSLIWLLHRLSKPWLGTERFSVHAIADIGLYAAMLAGLLLCAYGFYWLFEARTVAIRKAVESFFLSGPGTAHRTA